MRIQQLIKCSLITTLVLNVSIFSDAYASGKKYKGGKSSNRGKGHTSCKHKNRRGLGHHKHDRNCGGDVNVPVENPTSENQLLSVVLGDTFYDLSITNGNTIRIPASKGEQGEQGLRGLQGLIGLSGGQGTAGLQGPIGLTGAQGYDEKSYIDFLNLELRYAEVQFYF